MAKSHAGDPDRHILDEDQSFKLSALIAPRQRKMRRAQHFSLLMLGLLVYLVWYYEPAIRSAMTSEEKSKHCRGNVMASYFDWSGVSAEGCFIARTLKLCVFSYR